MPDPRYFRTRMDRMKVFSYSDSVLSGNPGVRAGVVQVTNVVNGPSPAGLTEAFRAEQQQVAALLSDTPISELPSIVAWRRAFTRFGTKPTQYRNAAESLLRRLDKHGDIPSINTLVDIGNMVSIRYAMPVAVLDRSGFRGAIEVRHAAGGEPFTDLGADQISHPEPGEVVFVDEAGVVCARRWCWRQSRQSATSAATSEALIVTEGLHESAGEDTERAVSELSRLLAEFLPEGHVEVDRAPCG